jgi:hypothetical protein
MLHPLTFALAILLAQDGAPTPAAPKPTPPAPPVQTTPAPLPTTTVPKARPGAAGQATAPANVAKKDAKQLVIPTPRVKEPEIPSYRVSVTMPGNRRFVGVVTRDKLFNDLIRLNAHNTQDVYRRTENFTLRFVDGVDGDVTLRWNQIVKLDVRAILDSAGLRTIEENYHRLMILKKAQEEADRAKQEEEEQKAGKQGDGEKPAQDPKGEKGEKKAKEEELPPLLAEFRPDEGWSPKRKEEIEWRRSILGTAPTAEEQRFLQVYTTWFDAFNVWQADKAAKAAESSKNEKGVKGEPAKDDAGKGDAKKDEGKKVDAKKDDSKKDDSDGEKPKSDDSKKDDSEGDDSKKDEKKDDAKKDEDGKDKDEKDKDDDAKKDESPKDPPAEPKDDGGGR